MCSQHEETVDHIVSGCEVLAKTEYISRHNKSAAYLHWSICKDHHIEITDKWYEPINRINCRFLGEIVHNLNHNRFKWSFKLFLVINFSLHISCRLSMTILSLLTYWLFKGFWSWDVFYTPGWILTGIVVIFAKNQQKKIWEAHWFNDTSINL